MSIYIRWSTIHPLGMLDPLGLASGGVIKKGMPLAHKGVLILLINLPPLGISQQDESYDEGLHRYGPPLHAGHECIG